MGRASYIRKRLFLMVFVLFGVTILIFSMVHFLPGDPAAVLLGERATVENTAILREQLGLNRPLFEQYWLFVSGLVRGQMGTFMFVLTTPSFWFGILLILVLALGLKWFPVAGFGATFQEHIWYLFLPAITLALQLSAVLIRNLRSQVIHTMGSDFARTARAKGLPERLVLLRHVLRNAVLSTVTIFGLQFGFLMGGTLVIETVFAVPGMGQLLFTSITSRDYPVVQAITVVSAVLVIIVNLIVDISYSFLDPRVTYE